MLESIHLTHAEIQEKSNLYQPLLTHIVTASGHLNFKVTKLTIAKLNSVIKLGSDDEDLGLPPSFLIGTSEERRDDFDDIQKQLEESAAIDQEKEKSKKAREEQQNLNLEEAAAQATKEAERLERVRLSAVPVKLQCIIYSWG